MGVYKPNIEMPRNCTECLEFKDDCEHYWDYYCTHESRPNNCPLIEIDDTVWENEKYKLIRMTQAVRINKEMAERRVDEDGDRVVETAPVRP